MCGRVYRESEYLDEEGEAAVMRARVGLNERGRRRREARRQEWRLCCLNARRTEKRKRALECAFSKEASMTHPCQLSRPQRSPALISICGDLLDPNPNDLPHFGLLASAMANQAACSHRCRRYSAAWPVHAVSDSNISRDRTLSASRHTLPREFGPASPGTPFVQSKVLQR
jgi:hypothetical protein